MDGGMDGGRADWWQVAMMGEAGCLRWFLYWAGI